MNKDTPAHAIHVIHLLLYMLPVPLNVAWSSFDFFEMPLAFHVGDLTYLPGGLEAAHDMSLVPTAAPSSPLFADTTEPEPSESDSESGPRLRRRLSPAIDTFLCCALHGPAWSGVELLYASSTHIRVRITDFALYMERAYQMHCPPPGKDPIRSRLKCLRNWFPDLPVAPGRLSGNDARPLIITAKKPLLCTLPKDRKYSLQFDRLQRRLFKMRKAVARTGVDMS